MCRSVLAEPLRIKPCDVFKCDLILPVTEVQATSQVPNVHTEWKVFSFQ